MNSMLCSRCKKRLAVVFVSRMEGDKTYNEGLCLQCAKELGIKPVEDLMSKMGITGDELDALNEQLMNPEEADDENFEMGGAAPTPGSPIRQGLAPLPFLNNLFGGASAAESEPSSGGAVQKTEKKNQKEKAPEKKFLNLYCEDLTAKARKGGFDPIIGRDREIDRVIQILCRRTKNNPCLIGEPGVGKTAIAEGIAQRIASGNVSAKLAEKELWLLDLTALVAGTQFRGQFESRVKGLVDEIKREGNIILFIDELHNLVGTGEAEGSMNAANILKPALSRGELQVIGATTFNEYRQHIEKDAALERRFQPVTVEEPTIADSIAILKGIAPNYEKFHHVKIDDELIESCVRLSERYITDRFLPDKAIDLLDEACSCAALADKELEEYEISGQKLRAVQEKIEALQQEETVDYEALATAKAEALQLEMQHNRLEPAALAAAE